MKKLGFILAMLTFLALCSITVMAAPKFDKTNLAKGYITVTYDGEVVKKVVKIKVEIVGSPATFYSYTVITNDPINIPLNLGNGKYKLTLMEQVAGTKYRGLAVEQFDVKVTSPNDAFLVPSPIVAYKSDTKAVVDYQKLFTDKKLTTPKTQTELLYQNMTKNFKYDYDKAGEVNDKKKYPDGYTPIIDSVYASQKGICYDYAAVTAAVLRSAGIPTKLVMGYTEALGQTYHAWNEIYLDNKWIVVDLTYDAAYVQAGQKTTMAKDAKQFKATKVY